MKVLAVIAMLFIATPSFAAERYFSLSGGTFSPGQTKSLNTTGNQVNTSYDTGWGAGGAFGVALDSGLRLESELAYRQAPAKSVSDDLWALGWLVNAWYDLRNRTSFTPYFGGGFGFGRGHTASPGPVDNSGSGIAYQVGGGIDYRFNQKISLDVGYRYFGISDLSSNDTAGKFDLAGSAVQAAVRVRF